MSADNLLGLAGETVNAVSTCLAITMDRNGDASDQYVKAHRRLDRPLHDRPRDAQTRRDCENRPHDVSLLSSGRRRYVTLVGHASIIDDIAAKQATWQPGRFKWHPGGPTDSNVVLIDFVAERVETWNSPGSYQWLVGRCAHSRCRRLALRRHNPRSAVQSKIIGAIRQLSDLHRAGVAARPRR
jgi:general stress protein 26